MQETAMTELTELVLPAQANHYGTLFAGQALSMLAQAAFTAASRHARSNVVLAGVENLRFTAPVPVGNLFIMAARVISAGRSSMVVEVIAREQPFASCTVSAIMSATVVCVPETAGVIEAIQLMRSHGVRRVPVVDAGGALVGILAADDLLDLLAEELSALARIAPRGQEREVRARLP